MTEPGSPLTDRAGAKEEDNMARKVRVSRRPSDDTILLTISADSFPAAGPEGQ